MENDAVVLGVWVGEDRSAAVLGSVRSVTGSVEADVIEVYGPMWQALKDAIEQALTVHAGRLILVCNDEELLRLLRPRHGRRVVRGFRIMAGFHTPSDPAHWSVLRMLGGIGGRWQVKQGVSRRAEELWQRQRNTDQ